METIPLDPRYAIRIRLQLCITALDHMIGAAPHRLDLERAGFPADEVDAFRAAVADARAALEIAYGQPTPVPPSLTAPWTDAQMVRDAARLGDAAPRASGARDSR